MLLLQKEAVIGAIYTRLSIPGSNMMYFASLESLLSGPLLKKIKNKTFLELLRRLVAKTTVYVIAEFLIISLSIPPIVTEADLARVILWRHLLSGHESGVVHGALVKLVDL